MNHLRIGFFTLALTAVLFCAALPALAQPQATTLVGSSDFTRFFGELAELHAQGAPAGRILVPPGVGSTAGIRAVLEGRAEAARVSRAPKPDKGEIGLTYVPAALSSPVFVVNLETAPPPLTPAALADAATGRVRNWKPFGGPDRKIYVLLRQPGDNMRELLEKLVPEMHAADPALFKIYSTNETLLDDLRRKSGAFSLLFRTEVEGLPNLRVLPFDSDAAESPALPPAVAGIVYKGEPSPALASFLAFLKIPAAKELIHRLGADPVE